jgi:anion-transporting  ArsA/GET3 family ATPase
MAAFEEPELCWLITFENEDAAMAESEYTLPRFRVEMALSAFLNSISEVRDIAENETRTSAYQDRVAATLDELNKATYHLLNPNLYRITVRDQEGKMSSRETRAASLYLAVQGQDVHFEIVKVERIHPITGKVLGGFYNE